MTGAFVMKNMTNAPGTFVSTLVRDDGRGGQKGLIGQKVCYQSSQKGYGSLWWSSSQTALSPHSGPPSSRLGPAE